MLQEQFYYRLLLIVAFGFIYVMTMMKMALYKPAEETKKKNLVMMIVGGIFILLALFEGGMGIYLLTQVQHPTEMIFPPISPDGIIRLTDPIWGYVTTPQWQVVSLISNTMTSLGWGAYFVFYCKSKTKWWNKMLKFLYAVLLYGFYLKASDLHYFDIWEWLPVIFFAIMSFYVYTRAKSSEAKPVAISQEAPTVNMDLQSEGAEIKLISEDKSRFMPKLEDDREKEVETTLVTDDFKDPEPQIVQQIEEKPVYKFCRYCGKEIDYEGVKYCKHCGKPLD